MGRLTMIATASLATLLLAEVALRWLPPGSWARGTTRPADLFVFDRELGYRLERDLEGVRVAPSRKALSFSVTTRAVNGSLAGYRDEGREATIGSVHVAVGDSFTFCWTEARDCWVELLESMGDDEFVNLGVPGYGGVQQARVLERDGLGLRPRVVLWGFFANDLHDNVRSRPAVEVHRWTWLGRKSVLLAMVQDRHRSSAGPSELVDSKRLPGLPVRSAFYADSELSKWVRGPAIDKGWPLQRQALLRAARQTEAIGARLIVVLMPLRELLYREAYASAQSDLGADDLERPNQLMREFCRRQGIPLFDPSPLFEERLGQQFFHERDAHLNALGNRILADGLAAFLVAGRYLELRTGGKATEPLLESPRAETEIFSGG